MERLSMIFFILCIYSKLLIIESGQCNTDQTIGYNVFSGFYQNSDPGTGTLLIEKTLNTWEATCCGVIVEWKITFTDSDDAIMQVWRPIDTSLRKYKLIGSKTLTLNNPNTPMEHTSTFTMNDDNEKLIIHETDVVGWYTLGGSAVIAYEDDPSLGTDWLTLSSPTNDLGKTITWENPSFPDTRAYGIEFTVGQGTAPSLSNLPTTISVDDNFLVGKVLFKVDFFSVHSNHSLTLNSSLNDNFDVSSDGTVKLVKSLAGKAGTSQNISISVTDGCQTTEELLIININLGTTIKPDLPTKSQCITGNSLGTSDVTLYTDTPGIRNMIVAKSSSFTSNCCGYISSWTVQPAETTDAHLYVWRPVENNKYLLVGVNNVSLDTNAPSVISSSEQVFSIPPAERIPIQPKDVVGWVSSEFGTNSIYECDACGLGLENGDFYEVDLTIEGEAILGQIMDFTNYIPLTLGINDKDFSLKYEVDPGNAPSFTSLPETKDILVDSAIGTTLHTITYSDADPVDNPILSLFSTLPACDFLELAANGDVKLTKTIENLSGIYTIRFRLSDGCHDTYENLTLSLTPLTTTAETTTDGETTTITTTVATTSSAETTAPTTTDEQTTTHGMTTVKTTTSADTTTKLTTVAKETTSAKLDETTTQNLKETTTAHDKNTQESSQTAGSNSQTTKGTASAPNDTGKNNTSSTDSTKGILETTEGLILIGVIAGILVVLSIIGIVTAVMMCNIWKMKKAFSVPRQVQSIEGTNDVQNNYKKSDPDRPETASSNNSRQSRQSRNHAHSPNLNEMTPPNTPSVSRSSIVSPRNVNLSPRSNMTPRDAKFW